MTDWEDWLVEWNGWFECFKDVEVPPRPEPEACGDFGFMDGEL